MSTEVLLGSVPLAAIAVALLAGGVWSLHHLNTLRLTLFRPYRGDPWPQGVQEEDDVRWQFSRRRVPYLPDADDDDTPSGPIDLTRLRISIRRGRG